MVSPMFILNGSLRPKIVPKLSSPVRLSSKSCVGELFPNAFDLFRKAHDLFPKAFDLFPNTRDLFPNTRDLFPNARDLFRALGSFSDAHLSIFVSLSTFWLPI